MREIPLEQEKMAVIAQQVVGQKSVKKRGNCFSGRITNNKALTSPSFLCTVELKLSSAEDDP